MDRNLKIDYRSFMIGAISGGSIVSIAIIVGTLFVKSVSIVISF